MPTGLIRRAFVCCVVAIAAACARTASTPPNRSADVRPAPSTPYTPGQSYFSANGYVEYVAGNAPVILTAPHGGAIQPASIPDRTAQRCGGTVTTTTDLNTVELVRAMRARYFARFGQYPHVVIAHISRRKLDLNRTAPEATCGNEDAETALREWHAFIDAAKRAVLQSFGKGWYMDMHGHGHPIQRLELGYLIDVDRSDADLNADRAARGAASVATMLKATSLSLSSEMRGPASLGTLFANRGFPAVPSAQDPRPNGAPYFAGGDNTRRHTCGDEAGPLGGASGGLICGVQIESNFTGVRNNAANRDRFGDVTALVLEQYLSAWGLRLDRR